MRNYCRSREELEGRLGRRRHYTCLECQQPFQVDTLAPLPNINMVCNDCERRTHIYTFTNKKTKRDIQVRGVDVEIATLKAWQISPHLTFKIPQPKENKTK